MGKNETYRLRNEEFLREVAARETTRCLPCGIYYRVVKEGDGKECPKRRSIVTVHYRGTLINGKEFDNSYKRDCPTAFRLNELIEGWQQALQYMHVGDKWVIFIPWQKGYGKRTCGDIPAFSTLIFEIELLGIV